MATMTKTHTKTKDAACCKPATCPTCGGTECFERPRYFSGQLLTDRDLDAAQRYVIDKNRLHNRYLVGTGVACGLAVRCDRCDAGTVVVQPGYGIDCCGNDIVLCSPATFNVAEALNYCKPLADPCGSPIAGSSPCDELPHEYYLVLYYSEEPTSPATALMRNGCGNVRCEPSRTKETYRLALVEKDEYHRRTEPSMWASMAACLKETAAKVRVYWKEFAQLYQQPPTPARHVALIQLFCKMRDAVRNLYQMGVNNRCTLAMDLAAIEATLPANMNDPDYEKKMMVALVKLFGYMAQYMIDCICDAMLVPCSSCDGDEGVLLACLTVKDCRVVKICNMARTQLLTGPSVRYWLQPVFSMFGKLLERVCCEIDLVALLDGFGTTWTPKQNPLSTPKAMANRPGMTDGASMTDAGAMPGFSADALTGRLATLAGMAQDYSSIGLDGFGAETLLPLFSTDNVMAMDLYQQRVTDVAPLLAGQKITYSTRQTTSDSEAYSFGNIGKMSWMLQPGSDVELVVDPKGFISGVRRKEVQHQ